VVELQSPDLLIPEHRPMQSRTLTAVVGAVPNAQKKHLLRLLVEKVLIQDRRTFAVWYRLPQFPAVRTLSLLVAPGCQCANHQRRAPRSPLARTVFQLEPCPDNRPEARSGVHVRVVGQGTWREPDRPVGAPSCAAAARHDGRVDLFPGGRSVRSFDGANDRDGQSRTRPDLRRHNSTANIPHTPPQPPMP
jgi:hypothetical protein